MPEDFGTHRPVGEEGTLDKVDAIFGPDVYAHPEWYTFSNTEPFERESIAVVKRCKGKPHERVTIYRALPPGHTEIRTGDWVAISEGYARQHAMQDDDPSHDWPVIKAEVEARYVFNGGNDLIEWGYSGPPIQARLASLVPKVSGLNVYYHVTSYRNWPAIRDGGLTPGADGHVWLFTDTDSAMLFKDAWGNPDVPPCIVVVRTGRAVPTEAGIPGAYWVEGPIPASEVYDIIRPDDLRHYAAKTAALPTSGLYWRTHDHERPFSPEDASSAPLWEYSTAPTRKGYSCLENPWDLWVYLLAYGWLQPKFIDNDDVICFSGTPKSRKGNDGEPLVIPDMQTVRRLTWPEFERELLATPRPDRPGGPGARHGYYDNWLQVGNAACSKRGQSVVAAALWAEAAEAAGVKAAKTARSGQDYSGYGMVCLKPSEALRKVYADMDETTEDLDELHITLYYLGEIDPGDLATKERYYRGLYDFVLHAGYRGLTGKVNGFGCFMNDDSNVLIALWDIPGIAEFRASLVGSLKEHAPDLRQDDHGFTPHMTLAYNEDSPFLRLPRLPDGNPEEEHFVSVWLVWGEEWTEVTLL